MLTSCADNFTCYEMTRLRITVIPGYYEDSRDHSHKPRNTDTRTHGRCSINGSWGLLDPRSCTLRHHISVDSVEILVIC